MVKLDVDTLPTVPDAPPAAGPDRALDPPPPAPGPLGAAADALPPGAAPDALALGAAPDALLLEPECSTA
jgi:hypothetical protein